MSMIRELKADNNGLGWLKGKFDSKTFYKGEMDITLFADSDQVKKYAEKCVMHYNSLESNQKIFDDIQDMLSKFMFYMYDEWKAMEIYDDIVVNTEKSIEAYNSGEQLVSCLSNLRLYVELPEEEYDEEIGYCIEADCPWEPEHQCSIIIRGDEVKYVGPSEGNTPWDDDDEYYCIWNDLDEE